MQSGECGRRGVQDEVGPRHDASDAVVFVQFRSDGEDEREERGRESRLYLAGRRESVPQNVAEVERLGRTEQEAEHGGISCTDGDF